MWLVARASPVGRRCSGSPFECLSFKTGPSARKESTYQKPLLRFLSNVRLLRTSCWDTSDPWSSYDSNLITWDLVRQGSVEVLLAGLLQVTYTNCCWRVMSSYPLCKRGFLVYPAQVDLTCLSTRPGVGTTLQRS